MSYFIFQSFQVTAVQVIAIGRDLTELQSYTYWVRSSFAKTKGLD